MKFPWLANATIEQAAEQLLVDTFGKVTPSVAIDLDAIVFDNLSEREGLIFSNERDLGSHQGEEILGRTFPIAGRIEITKTLTSSHLLGRYRFTIAHELGHWRLHRPHFLAAAQQSDLFLHAGDPVALTSLKRGIFPGTAAGVSAIEEWQANRFAIALLVSRTEFRNAFELRFGPAPIPRQSPGWSQSPTLRAHARLLASATVNRHPPLRDIFKLSTEAMAIVIESLGYATDFPGMI